MPAWSQSRISSPVEVAAIGKHGQLFGFPVAPRACLAIDDKLGSVMADVGDFVGDDQMVLGVDRGLHVVADDAGAPATGGHRARIRIGQRDLLVGCVLQLLSNLVQALHLLFDRGDLLLEPGQPCLR